MKYRRTPTRPPRAVEQSDAMRENQELRERVQALTARLAAANERIYILESLRDELQREVGRLVVELRHERNKNQFLQGFDGPGHQPRTLDVALMDRVPVHTKDGLF